MAVGGATNSLAGLLGTGGPIMGALLGIAATVGVVAIAAKAIASKNNEDAHNYSAGSNNLFNEYMANGNMSRAQAAVESMNKAQSENRGRIFF